MEKETLENRQGTTGASKGWDYEIQLLMLFIVRALAHGIVSYKLASNIENAGNFDDLVVQYNYEGKVSLIFLQAKHVSSKIFKFDKTQLQPPKKEKNGKKKKTKFEIKKFFESYKNIKGFNLNDDHHFIIYTNALMEESLITHEQYFQLSEESIVTKIFNTSGDVYEINKDKIANFIEEFIKLDNTCDKEAATKFISHLKFFVNQSSSTTINTEIEKEIRTQNPKLPVAVKSNNLFEDIKSWAESDIDTIITEKSNFYEKFVVKNFDRKALIAEREIKYGNNALSDLRLVVEENQIIEIVVPEKTLLLGEAKVVQCLDENTETNSIKEYYFLISNDLLKCKSELEKLMKENKCSDAVVVSITTYGTDLKKAISNMLSLVNEKKIKLILLHEHNLAIDMGIATFYKYEDNKLTCKDCSKEYISKILTMNVKFQGNKNDENEIKLEKIVNTDSLECIDGKTVIDLLFERKSVNIGNALPKFTSFYIPRKFVHRRVINSEIFSDKEVCDLFVFTQKDKPSLKSLLSSNFEELVQNATSTEKKVIFITSETNVCDSNDHTKIQRKNIHLLEIHSNRFVWVKTKGSVFSLLKYAEDYPIDLDIPVSNVTETDMATFKSEDKLVVLADTAGTGKSTVLTSIGQQIKKNCQENDDIAWIERFDLNNCRNEMEEFIDEKTQMSDGFELLLKLLNFKSQFEKMLFRNWCENKKKVSILFDGFDEIKSKYQELIIELIEKLQSLKLAQIWIASRPEMTKTLEKKFKVFSYCLVELSDVECKKILVDFWKKRYKIIDADLEKIESTAAKVTEILKNIRNCNDKYSFCGIPLQVKMAAEIYSDKVLSTDSTFPNLDKNSFYELFIDKKFDIYLKEKKKEDKTHKSYDETYTSKKRKFENYHQIISIHELLTEEEKQILLNDQNIKKLNEILTSKIIFLDYGIVDVLTDKKVSFIHRTFAEFFMAKFIVKQMLKCCDDKISEMIQFSILTKEKFEVTRSFINNDLKRDSKNKFESLKVGNKRKNNDMRLHVAAKENNVAIMSYLLNSTSDKTIITQLTYYKDSTDSSRNTPLHIASLKGHIDAVNLILQCNNEIVNSKNIAKETALHLAAKNGHVDVVISLIKYEADVNDKDKDGNTALHLVAWSGHVDVVKDLLPGADVNDKNKDGSTALHIAARRGHVDVVESLLQGKADINVKNKDEGTALHEAAKGGYVDVVKSLHCHVEADVNARDKDGDMALHMAASSGHVDVVNFLLQHSADINEKNKDGDTALHLAAGGCHVDLVKSLLFQGGTDVRAKNKDGATALHKAASSGHVDVVNLLLEGGADVNDKDLYGYTAMHKAAGGDFGAVVKCLLKFKQNNI